MTATRAIRLPQSDGRTMWSGQVRLPNGRWSVVAYTETRAQALEAARAAAEAEGWSPAGGVPA